MNLTIVWMLALPIFGALAFYYIAGKGLSDWRIAPLTAIPGLALVGLVFLASYGAAVNDTEIWNGQITSKERVHGTYQESYECNCTRDSKGNKSCSTCYRTHYTVHWYAHSTIGRFTIDSEDSTWRSVYNTPDPGRYTAVQVGDPCSKTNSYTNYVQAVPDSLFHSSSKELSARFQSMLPQYPDRIFDHYRINRFLTPGFAFTDAPLWDRDVGMMLRELGPSKQVNVIVVVVKTADPDYVFALRDQWEGANKNDVVVVMGSLDGVKIEWTRIISWTKSEIFKVQLTDSLSALGVIDRTKIVPIIHDQIAKNFERRRMREFEYLKGQIDPPTWLLTLTIVLLVVGYGGGALYANRVA